MAEQNQGKHEQEKEGKEQCDGDKNGCGGGVGADNRSSGAPPELEAQSYLLQKFL